MQHDFCFLLFAIKTNGAEGDDNVGLGIAIYVFGDNQCALMGKVIIYLSHHMLEGFTLAAKQELHASL